MRGAWTRRAPGGLKAFEDQSDGHRPFADGRGAALDRPAADVAHAEDARSTGLQEQRRPAVTVRLRRDFAAGEEEPVGVGGQLALEPPGGRLGADEDEEPRPPT